ncbi:MAG: two-component sensor histidine kinase [Acidobacteria bacterium]|nr:two-component sensor histidine kinase [Acidobacteriota bacterium]|tara:strand:- start:221 stop:1126 length:906 start_codon:yes stop_codon:yes gene_type:complete
MDRSGGTRRRAVVLVWLLGAGLIAVAVALNISFIVVNWRAGLLLLVGVVSFVVLIGGLALNTAFLVREIRKSEQHDAFIHAVTHELKTPLASIKLYLQTLQQRELDSARRGELIDTMLEDSERLQQTIDQILLAGKTGDARRVDNPTDVDVAEVVGECVHLVGKRHHLTNGEVSLVDRLPCGTRVLGDRDELVAAVTNLVDNAIKYSGDRVKVVVEVASAGARRVAISVRDQGIGITSVELKRVFRRFYRLPDALQSRVRGTGVGLSIVRAVARRHGGRAYAESRGAGQGSTFTLELPLKT